MNVTSDLKPKRYSTTTAHAGMYPSFRMRTALFKAAE